MQQKDYSKNQSSCIPLQDSTSKDETSRRREAKTGGSRHHFPEKALQHVSPFLQVMSASPFISSALGLLQLFQSIPTCFSIDREQSREDAPGASLWIASSCRMVNIGVQGARMTFLNWRL